MSQESRVVMALIDQMAGDIKEGINLPIRFCLFFKDCYVIPPANVFEHEKEALCGLMADFIRLLKPHAYSFVCDTNIRNPRTGGIEGEGIFAGIVFADENKKSPIFQKNYKRSESNILFSETTLNECDGYSAPVFSMLYKHSRPLSNDPRQQAETDAIHVKIYNHCQKPYPL